MFWKVSALLSESQLFENSEFKIRKPPMPELFSESLCCLSLGLYHCQNKNPDAFELITGKLYPVEIKATTTENGFQEIKNENYHFLYWIDLFQMAKLEYTIYKFDKETINNALQSKKTKKINLRKLINDQTRPVYKGKLGIVEIY
mgnify:CR=1 FL=1